MKHLACRLLDGLPVLASLSCSERTRGLMFWRCLICPCCQGTCAELLQICTQHHYFDEVAWALVQCITGIANAQTGFPL